MKHILRMLVIVIVFLFVLFVSGVAGGSVSAVDTTPVATQATSAQGAKEYFLPYPGILPDHPLYKIKLVRDWILERIIVDPIRKTEFYILQGDKRLNMGIALVEKGNSALAGEVISQSGNFMEQAMHTLTSIKTAGREVPLYVLEHMESALVKHNDVLETMRVNQSGSAESVIIDAQKHIQALRQDIAKVR
ncbi:hypothetical protein KKB64_04785 [Patescibacteria group bacterium]|nr:hypothetical protein [Patescibacteria group bacterium]MBU1473067.1 hypothetical protein [Patescibacteria group bacterium]MBU2460177.1 hypothetical protein [Patescibacteria group bacterium]MBU2544493.1 hypothetical protein [Patescibacteria group bacterium]